MTPFTIYLWQQADTFRETTLIFTVMSLTAWGLIAFIKHTEEGEMIAKWPALVLVPAFLFALLIPSSKTIAMMVAIPAIANSEPIQKDLPELYQLAKDALKEQITGKSTK